MPELGEAMQLSELFQGANATGSDDGTAGSESTLRPQRQRRCRASQTSRPRQLV